MPEENSLLDTLQTFFPLENYSEEIVAEGVKHGEIITNPALLINYLQGTLHDESLLEAELGDLKRVFFCRVLDHPPGDAHSTSNKDETAIPPDEAKDIPYNKGDYLKEIDHLILTPLEPAEGNYLINTSPQVILRVLTTQTAIEFCCFFLEKLRIAGMPVIRLSFPRVARLVDGAREYRVKVPADMDLKIMVHKKKSNLKFTTRPMDMSMNGMSLLNPKGREDVLQVDDPLSLQIISSDMILMTLDARIRHVTRLRDARGLQYIFGVQLDLESRAMASEVEKLVAGIQRARLRELVELEDEHGVNLEGW